jgi:hypothetical protein
MAKQRKQPRGLTTLKGVGHRHRQQREYLLQNLVDGTACWWCGRGLYHDPLMNFDRRPLAADHTVARIHGGVIADRLLHFTCNSERRSGEHDDERPALTGKRVADVDKPDLGIRAMAWPDR